jgi:hypothetical protein
MIHTKLDSMSEVRTVSQSKLSCFGARLPNGRYMPTTTNNPRIITKEAEYRDYYNIAAIVSSQISLVSVALYRSNLPYNIDLIQPCFGP